MMSVEDAVINYSINVKVCNVVNDESNKMFHAFDSNGFVFRSNKPTNSVDTSLANRVKSIQSDLVDWVRMQISMGHFISAYKAIIYLADTYKDSNRFQQLKKVFLNYCANNTFLITPSSN